MLESRVKGKEKDKAKEGVKARYRAGLKGLVYFVSCFLEDVWTSGEQEAKVFKEGKKGKRKVKKTRKRQPTEGKEGFEDSDDDTLPFEKLLEEVGRTAERRVACIWKEGRDEESYLKLYVKIVFVALEQPDIVSSPDCRKSLKLTLRGAIHSAKGDCKGLFQLVSGQTVHLLYSIVLFGDSIGRHR